MLNGLQSLVDFLTKTSPQECSQDNGRDGMIENLAKNCICLCDCVEIIVKIRYLDNFNAIGKQVMKNTMQILNSVFIKLTDTCPLLAIQISKLIQLLSLEKS